MRVGSQPYRGRGRRRRGRWGWGETEAGAGLTSPGLRSQPPISRAAGWQGGALPGLRAVRVARQRRRWARTGESVEGREQERRVGSAELRVDHEPAWKRAAARWKRSGLARRMRRSARASARLSLGSSRAEARAMSGFPCASAFLNLPRRSLRGHEHTFAGSAEKGKRAAPLVGLGQPRPG